MNAENARPLLVVKPGVDIDVLYLRELWAYRELLYFLAWRDIKVRYKHAVLGAAWAIMQPVLTMVVFSIVFGKLGKIPSDGVPYPLFCFAALLPWQLFAYSLNSSAQSLVAGSGLITKVYFPRLIMPIASVVTGLADFAVACGVVTVIMLYYGVIPTWRVMVLPAFVGMAIISALAVGVWLSVLNVKYRDVRFALPFLTQFWLFLSPVAYPASMIPEQWQWLYGLNPMAGVIEGFRWALVGSSPPVVTIYTSMLLTAILFVGGIAYFLSHEKWVADIV